MYYTLTLNPALDLCVRLDHDYQKDTIDSIGGTAFTTLGGKGINVSRALAHRGAKSIAVYAMRDLDGITADRVLKEEGIIPHRLPGGKLRTTFEITFENGRRAENLPPISDGAPDAPEAARQYIEEHLSEEDTLFLSGSLPYGAPADTYAHLVAAAKHKGARVILDAAGEPLRLAVTAEEKPDLVKPNLAEFTALTGFSLPAALRDAPLPKAINVELLPDEWPPRSPEKEAREAAQFFPPRVEMTEQSVEKLDHLTDAAQSFVLETGIAILLTLGEEGAVYADGTGVLYVPAVELGYGRKVVSTRGAGDTYLGNFILAMDLTGDAFRAMSRAAYYTAGHVCAIRRDIPAGDGCHTRRSSGESFTARREDYTEDMVWPNV